MMIVGAVTGVCALLILPAMAMHRLDSWVPWPAGMGIIGGVSVITFVVMWADKRRAQHAGQRIPEALLHGLEALGGWPGSLMAQRRFHHKTRKASYQAVFWLIVFGHQALAGLVLHGVEFGFA